MDSETPYLKWTAAAIGFVIVCFCVGFFVLGPKGATQTGSTGGGTVRPAAVNNIIIPKTTPAPDLNIVETTTAREAATLRIKDLEAEVEKLKSDNADMERRIRAKSQAEIEAANTRAQARRDAEAEAKRERVPKEPSDQATPEPDKTDKPDKVKENNTEGNNGTKSEEKNSKLYRVLVGPFDSRDEATNKSDEMKSRGYAAIVRKDMNSGRYYVQNGVFSKQNAEERQKELHNNGYDVDVIGD